jgi:hypothetical protein
MVQSLRVCPDQESARAAATQAVGA